MKKMIKKYNNFINIANENVSISDITTFSNGFKKFDIFFKMNINNIVAAIAIINYLKSFNLSVNDSHIIHNVQATESTNILHVFIDNQNGHPNFTIEKGVNDKISGDISLIDLFSHTDIENIKVVDKNDFLKYKITSNDIYNWVFKSNKDLTPARRNFFMKLFINKIMVDYKDKLISVTNKSKTKEHVNKNIIECVVIDSEPTVQSIYDNLVYYVNNATAIDKTAEDNTPKKLAKPEELSRSILHYINKKIEEINSNDGVASNVESNIEFDDDAKIIKQYVTNFKSGINKYIVFKNEPEANFICAIYGPNNHEDNNIGILQSYCNPYKEKTLSYVNMDEISKLFLSKFRTQFEHITLTLEQAKKINDLEKQLVQNKKEKKFKIIDFNSNTVLNTFRNALYKYIDGHTLSKLRSDVDSEMIENIKRCMDKAYLSWGAKDRRDMSSVRIKLWDIIVDSSSGDTTQSTIQGINYISARRDLMLELFDTDSFSELMKMFGDIYCDILIERISQGRRGIQVRHATGGIKLYGEPVKEDFNYFINDKNGEKMVSKEEFVKLGFNNLKNDFFKINMDDKGRVIGQFINKIEIETNIKRTT